jgi:hypothetical protein
MTLRAFIHFIGGVVFVVGLGLIAFFFLGYPIYACYHRGLVIGLIVGAVLFSLIGGLIARTGWRMLRRWDNAVVVEYAEIQSFITGIAIGKIAGLYWPHATGIAIGFMTFLLIRRSLRRLVLGILGMPPEHSRQAVEMAMHSDVAGTPWRNNPAHTR